MTIFNSYVGLPEGSWRSAGLIRIVHDESLVHLFEHWDISQHYQHLTPLCAISPQHVNPDNIEVLLEFYYLIFVCVLKFNDLSPFVKDAGLHSDIATPQDGKAGANPVRWGAPQHKMQWSTSHEDSARTHTHTSIIICILFIRMYT